MCRDLLAFSEAGRKEGKVGGLPAGSVRSVQCSLCVCIICIYVYVCGCVRGNTPYVSLDTHTRTVHTHKRQYMVFVMAYMCLLGLRIRGERKTNFNRVTRAK